MDIQKKLDELGNVVSEYRKATEAELKQLKEKGYIPADYSEKEKKLNDKISELEGQIKGLETAMTRRGGKDEPEQKGSTAEVKAAVQKYLRKGIIEEKALSSDSGPDGGYLITPEQSAEIQKIVNETTPFRQIASVQTIGSDALDFYEDNGILTSGWVGERQSRTETATTQLGMIQIPVAEVYAMPKTTQKMLDDASWNVEAWLTEKASEAFALKENNAFINGDGQLKPKGILSYAAGTSSGQIEQVNSGHASQLTADGLLDLFYQLKTPYVANSSWLMARLSVKAIRKFKDNDGQYLWQPSLVAGAPATFNGRPIIEAPDMPAIGAGNLPVAFGDFKAAYQIVDRLGIRVLRDNVTEKGFVLFYSTKRVGGGVKKFEAIKIQKVSA